MSVVVTFERVTPVARYDGDPWTHARIEESDASDGTYAEIDTIDLSTLTGGIDSDPSDPAARNLTTANGTELEQWYRIVFVDGDDNESAPTSPIQNTTSAAAYATVDEFFRIIKIRNPSDDQTEAAMRVLAVAAGEINAEIDLGEDTTLSGWQLQLAAEVNLERAHEHWRQQETPFGLIGLGPEMGGVFAGRDSWTRHALKLAPLKDQWGIA